MFSMKVFCSAGRPSVFRLKSDTVNFLGIKFKF
jgi:hypothetical protein